MQEGMKSIIRDLAVWSPFSIFFNASSIQFPFRVTWNWKSEWNERDKLSKRYPTLCKRRTLFRKLHSVRFVVLLASKAKEWMRYQESGLRLLLLYEFTSLFVTSYRKFMRAAGTERRRRRTRRARSIGIIRFEGRGGEATLFESRYAVYRAD